MPYPSGSADSQPDPSGLALPSTCRPSAPVSLTSPTLPSRTATVTGSPGATPSAPSAGVTSTEAGFGAGTLLGAAAFEATGSPAGAALHAAVSPTTPAATSPSTRRRTITPRPFRRRCPATVCLTGQNPGAKIG
ncbi:hypothetical protein GCM10023192_85390 [Amycolatopsis samaneae]